MERVLIRKLPKCEFHLHFEGAVPYSLLRERYPEKYAKIPASWAPDFRFDDFDHFERDLLGYAEDWFTAPEDYHKAASVIFADQLENNVRYLETSISSGCVELGKMDLDEAAGKFIKAHAGEFDGPGFIRRAIRELAAGNIVLDICPWSNLKLGVVRSLAEHPLRALHDAGVKCTINRDDPVSFGTSLTDEYAAVAEEMGFTDEEVISLFRNGIETALVPETRKKIWLDELDKAAKGI